MEPSPGVNSLDCCHLILPISVSFAHSNFDAMALVDSGCTRSLMNPDFAVTCSIPLYEKRYPVRAEAIDGRSLDPIRWETPELLISVGDRVFPIVFDVFPCKHADVVLGMLWLAETAPTVDWSKRTIRFGDPESAVGAAAASLVTSPSLEVRVSTCVPKTTTTLVSCEDVLPKTAVSLEPREDVLPVAAPDPPREDTKAELPAAYADYADVFEKGEAEKLPPHRPYDCAINLMPGASVPRSRRFRMSADEQKLAREYVDDFLAKGLIRPSRSPGGASMLFVGKKDGTKRPCIDYRELNKVTVRNAYPLPHIGDLLDRLATAKVFTKIDLRSAYHLVRIREGDEYKTAFYTPTGLYEYLVMPFGLVNAPSTFQHFINDVFHDLLDVCVVVYLDDILVYSNSAVQHEAHVRMVLDRLRAHKLFAKLEKCEFNVLRVEFLGYLASAEGIEMAPSKVAAVLEWEPPHDVKGIQQFLGFANFCRRFIDRYASITKPLTELTRKGVPFVWSPRADAAFRELKAAFAREPVLVHADLTAPFVLETDASDFALGAVLSQEGPDGCLRPVAFHSRALRGAELNYHVHDKELLAIVDAFKAWRHYLVGSPHEITVYCDHRNLQHWSTEHDLNGRQARWAQFLASFAPKIVYRAGRLQVKADALSRRREFVPKGGGEASGLRRHVLIPAERIRADAAVLSGTSPEPDVGPQVLQEAPPPAERLRIFNQYHDNPLAGHFGLYKTLKLISRDYSWPNLKRDVKDYIRSCDVCSRSKTPRHRPFGLLQPLPVPDRPWGSVSLDFIVDLPPVHGFDSVLVVVDRLTKLAHFIACSKTATAEQTADLFLDHVVRHHGLPDSIVSDRGPQFSSRFWRRLWSLLRASTNLSSGHHPQSNGQTERVNQVLEQYLRCYATYDQSNWVRSLPLAEFAYNNADHESIGMSPFLATYGVRPRLSFDQPPPVPLVPSAEARVRALADLHAMLKANLREAQGRHKRNADVLRREAPDLAPGSKVWLHRAHIKTTRPSDKLDYKKLGPYIVKRKVNAVAYELELPPALSIHPVFHVSLLEPYYKSLLPGRTNDPPPPLVVNNSLEYEVEAILDSRHYRRSLQYLVMWKGYPEPSWEPAKNVSNAQRLVKEFHEKYPFKPTTISRRSV